MKKYWLETLTILAIIGLIILTFLPFCNAATVNAHIVWTYNNPPSDLTGFNLYNNGAKIDNFQPKPTDRVADIPLDIPDGRSNFTMTAFDADSESVQSDPFVVNPSPHGIDSLQITFGQ